MPNSGISKEASGRKISPEIAGLVDGVGGLHLVGRDHDGIDQDARHEHLLRLERAGLRQPLDLRDDDAAIVADRQRLIERAEIGALMLIGEVAALVGGGGADDRHIGDDRREVQPFVAGEFDTRTTGSPAALAFIAQPSRRGSTKVSMPTLVSTPGRLAAASRCMSNRMPEGML